MGQAPSPLGIHRTLILMLSAYLTRLAKRLRTTVDDTGKAWHQVMSDLPDDLRRIKDNYVSADSKGAGDFGRFDPDSPQLVGISALTGLPHVFSPHQVRSIPITDSSGKTIGISFPLKIIDHKESLRIPDGTIELIRERYVTEGMRPASWIHRTKKEGH